MVMLNHVLDSCPSGQAGVSVFTCPGPDPGFQHFFQTNNTVKMKDADIQKKIILN